MKNLCQMQDKKQIEHKNRKLSPQVSILDKNNYNCIIKYFPCLTFLRF
jgi:hypothetical protein